ACSLEHRVQGSLRRVMVHGRVPAGDTPVRVASVHIDHEDAAVRLAQAREAVAWVVPLADPSLDVVVAGDFNATETSPPLAAAASFGFANLAEGLGAGRIDHVLAHRGGAFAKDGARIVFDGGETPVVSDHPGVVVTLRPEPAVDVTRTRVRATADLPDGSWLAVRGSAAPLSWDRGWPMLRTGPAAHLLVLTEVAAGTAFEFKCLADDTAWQAGGNVAATGGQDTEVAPAF
ncbi:MAG: endonuclease/exonuclease/phosphatase family protein, partial [Deltaproteobacteria bacterium]|nr:endonuclease/exonuclease/phosphatase family protein [Deltaproteobacteria bacterium]